MSIRRNTLYNLLGRIAPLGVSLVTVPLYLHAIGEARYGVLAIIWLFTGYFGVFEMGLSRASAYYLARQHDELPVVRSTTFWTAVLLNLGLGLLGALVLYVVAQPVFTHFFHMPDTMRRSVLMSLPWIAAALPLSILGGVLAGALESRERFLYMNLIGVFNTTVTQIGPLLVAAFITPELTWLIPAVVISRASGLLLQFFGVWRFLPIVPSPWFNRVQAKELFSYGGWVFLTNISVSILSTFDRMILGAMLSVQAVTYYTVPQNLVSRLNIIPGALTTTLFPRFSRENSVEGNRLAIRAIVILIAITTPIAIFGIIALPLFLHYWISPRFSDRSAITGMILLSGAWINGLAFVPYSLIQGNNRNDLIAWLHIIEVPFFIAILWTGIRSFGLPGAALAPAIMAGIDAIALFYFSRTLKVSKKIIIPFFLIFFSIILAPRTILSVNFYYSLTIILMSFIWSILILPETRNLLINILIKIRKNIC